MNTPIFPRVSRYDEVAIYTAPRPGLGLEEESGAPSSHPRISHYDNWVYSSLLPVRSDAAKAPGGGVAPALEMGGLPLVVYFESSFQWLSYAEYLAVFLAGGENFLSLEKSLDRSRAPKLLLGKPPPPEGIRLRIWWLNAAPEMEDISWESVCYPTGRPPRLWQVRGAPCVSVPPLPLAPDRQLTIAVFDPAGLAPEPLLLAFEDIRPSVTILKLEAKDPREALREAARAGVEVVHVVADGRVPLNDVDGLLDFPDGALLTPGEAHSMLRGSRAAILSLSAPASPHLDAQGLPTVYRGYARFGRAIGDGLSVVAPLGPVAPLELRRFWREFYQRFVEVLDVEDALVSATPYPLKVPMVLFLRNRLGRQFTRCAESDVDLKTGVPGSANPARASAELAISGSLLEAAQTLQQRYAELGLEFPGKGLIRDESEREQALATYLDAVLADEMSR
jgi:hypothetical protein